MLHWVSVCLWDAEVLLYEMNENKINGMSTASLKHAPAGELPVIFVMSRASKE